MEIDWVTWSFIAFMAFLIGIPLFKWLDNRKGSKENKRKFELD